ncbi:NAD-dependent epimerase/dehydratase family protein [Leptolyngbya cf. ectocarpi LEGE 11479]|uniref:NAD-dependent epimerase/dehydratase family protein n=2 Tax=Leptolyngbya ectocarpi TaxID=1202 RepID=A0A929FAY7_LEPEC|nr:NAD-dependent epimerase/dehydratase family protein [Leptolyngbya cf. ectocarpi LEGE 11479]
MHFLVTGGAGFIGSHLVEHLLATGYHVTVIDNLSTGKRQNLLNHSKLIFLEENVLTFNPKKITAQCDALVHLAATPSVSQSWIDPLVVHDNTLSGTVAVIQLCHQLKIPRIVFASSAAVYGKPSQMPVSEDCETFPLSPYGLQKLASEQYMNLFSRHLGLVAVNLRMFNVFGPRQDPSSPYSGVISIFARAMMDGHPISINGNGKQTRDFIYVKDVVLAFEKALTVPLKLGDSLTCNIGTGSKMSILQLKDTLQHCFPRWQNNVDFIPSCPGDIQDSQADISKARLFLGFKPQFSAQDGMDALKKAWLKC